MTTPIRDMIVYVFGPPDLDTRPQTDRVDVKVGKSNNNQNNFDQRLAEDVRHVPRNIVLAKFVTHLNTNNPDDFIRLKLCEEFPDKFGCTHGRGRDVLQHVLVSDIPFLLEQIARYVNLADTGRARKYSYLMRSEQESCLDKTLDFMMDPTNSTREFLWDCKMRFGKTFTALQLITKLNAYITLILTNRPTDTKAAWQEGLDHVDFPDYVFIDSSEFSDNNPIKIDPSKKYIIFSSLQDYARLDEQGNLKGKFRNLQGVLINVLIKDEGHLAFDTPTTKEAIKKLNVQYPPLILSGTPFRYLWEGTFAEDAIFTWSYIDEQHARTQEIAAIGVERAAKEGQYYWLSPLTVYTILLSTELYEDVDLFSEEEGFNFAKLFEVQEKNGRNVFANDLAVDHWLYTMSHGTVMPFSKNVKKNADGSQRYSAINLSHTLWCLPSVAAVKLLAEKMSKHAAFKHYDVIVAADDNNGEGKDTAKLVKDRIALIEKRGNPKNKLGTITLIVEKLIHGVTVPEWGSVLLMTDMKSAQYYFQLIFRCQSEWKDNKRECYVFDFKPNRTLQCFYEVAQAAAKSGDPVPVLREMLDVFNVQSYEGNDFKKVDASDLISKLESGFGRPSSLEGLQKFFADLPFDLDDDLALDISDIEVTGSSKAPKGEVEVNSNPDAPDGKTYKSGDDDNEEEDDTHSSPSKDGEKEKEKKGITEEQRKVQLENAKRAIPLYFFLIRARSFDDLMESLSSDTSICKTITGMSASKLKKNLMAIPADKQQSITEALVRFRHLESNDNQSFQKEIMS